MRLVVAAAGLCGAGEHVRAGGRIQPGSAGTARGRRAGLMAGGCGVAVPGAGSAHSRGVSGIGGVLVIRPGMTVYARRCRRRPAGGSCAPAGARACGSRSRLPRPAWIGPGWIGPGWRAGRGRSAARAAAGARSPAAAGRCVHSAWTPRRGRPAAAASAAASAGLPSPGKPSPSAVTRAGRAPGPPRLVPAAGPGTEPLAAPGAVAGPPRLAC
jgi:hypothetical protein